MQKQAPSIGRIAVAMGFALSCFGLLLFLWITFGGPIPLAPKSYRFTADFPEAITMQTESDVRLGGVSVGKVKEVSLPPDGNATRATIELEPEFAPLSADAKAILRQKTLLGETYVEITSGTAGEASTEEPTAQTGGVDSLVGDDVDDPIEEGGHLEDSQISEQVQIDEIFNALDDETRNAFRVWQQNTAVAAQGRGLDINDGFGNLGPFASDASDLLETLNRQDDALSQLVSSTGEVFGALTKRDQQLAGLIEGNNKTFGALASRDEALEESISIFPTFNMEARKTLSRLQSFSVNARPLAKDLKPVARDLSPALRDVRNLTPSAKSLFTNLGPFVDAAQVGLPQTRGVVRELEPVLQSLDPFLANLNPILRYTGAYSGNVTDFIANPEAGIGGTLQPIPGQPAPRHALRQIGYISPESLSIYPFRLPSNRGNGYLPPNAIGSVNSVVQNELFPNHDCDNTGATGGLGQGQVTLNPPSTPQPTSGTLPGGPATEQGTFPLSILPNPLLPSLPAHAACTITPPSQFGGERVPYVPADS